MKLLSKLGQFLGLGKTKEPKKEIIKEDGSVEAPRMRTGNHNGILSIPERNHANRQFNKGKKNRKKRKLANKARNLQHQN